jgi:hypothetical protein
MTVLGTVGSIIGGYVGAWLAGHDETLNGALSSWLCLAFEHSRFAGRDVRA